MPFIYKNNSTGGGSADVSGKADKVSGATAGNFAALDQDGNLKDSGKSADSCTSKQEVIESFCPEIQKSGTFVQMDGLVEGYPLGVKVSWEPTQEGSGDPSPENIRPIQGRDSVKVERCGENLLKFNDQIVDDKSRTLLKNDDLVLLSKCFRGKDMMLTFACDTENIIFEDASEMRRRRIGFEYHGFLSDGSEVWDLQCWLTDDKDTLTKNGKHVKTVKVRMPDIATGEIMFYAQNIKSGTFTAYDFGIYEGETLPDKWLYA